MTTTPPTKCIGFWGKIKGHRFRFMHFLGEYSYGSDYCFRCGMPKGGWGK